MKTKDNGMFETLWVATAILAAILFGFAMVGCTTTAPVISYTPINSSISSARNSIQKAGIVLTNCNPETLQAAQLELGMASTRLNMAEELLKEQATEVLELERLTRQIPEMKLKIAEQRGTIWKLILITSGVILTTIGIFIFRQALLNIPVIGWAARLIGL
jgi:hypothetical protein